MRNIKLLLSIFQFHDYLLKYYQYNHYVYFTFVNKTIVIN